MGTEVERLWTLPRGVIAGRVVTGTYSVLISTGYWDNKSPVKASISRFRESSSPKAFNVIKSSFGGEFNWARVGPAF